MDIDTLAEEYWAHHLRVGPTNAHLIGDYSGAGRFEEVTRESEDREISELRDGAEPLDADAVRAFATGKLAHYKIPRYVMIVDEFPMTVTGKIRKVQMREETTAKLGLDPADHQRGRP